MINRERLRALMAQRGLSQSELARRVGVSQATIYKLLTGESYGSKHLHKIARELQTTAAYLVGEIDDPAVDALPPAPASIIHVTMPVALPTERALERMFAGLLRPFELAREDELARTLARQLPKGLQRLQGPLIEVGDDDRELEGVATPANDRPVPQRAQRT